jgi:hypothetical protein
VKPISVACPICGAEAGRNCFRVGGAARISFHRARTTAAVDAAIASGAMKPRPKPKKRVVKRFGAFLRLYGPKGRETHAVLVLGHGPEIDTPRGFLDELDVEEKTERHARGIGTGTEFRIHFSGRPRPRLPSYGAATRRVLNLVWPHGCSMPPLLCAGRKQMGYPQAWTVSDKLGQERYLCDHCGRYHLKGKRHGPGRST